MNQKIQKLINVTNLSKTYNGRIVLSNINIEINRGDKIGIIGPNGSGKTTLAEIIAKLRPISTGSVDYFDDIVVGMQLQESPYPPVIRAIDMIKYQLKTFHYQFKDPDMQKVFDFLEIRSFLKIPIQKLSRGQQQRMNFLFALIVKPDIIILDELCTALDINTREKIYFVLDTFLKHKEKTLIFISHSMSEIEKYCDKTIFLLNGKIVDAKTKEEILRKHASIEEYVKATFSEYKVGVYDNTKTEGLDQINWSR